MVTYWKKLFLHLGGVCSSYLTSFYNRIAWSSEPFFLDVKIEYQNACLRISGEPIWHQLTPAAVYGIVLPFCSLPVVLGPEAGVERGCCAAHTSAFLCLSQTHLMSLRAVAGNQRQELCLCLDLTGSKSFYNMSLKFLLITALCPAPATVKLALISFFLSLLIKEK